MLDTDVVIRLRDGDDWTIGCVDELNPPLLVSAITRAELENGVYRDAALTAARRKALDSLLGELITLDLSLQEIAAYRSIVEAVGYSRRKMADRLTAATALAADLPLVTFNGKDFRDIPGLELIEWTRPE